MATRQPTSSGHYTLVAATADTIDWQGGPPTEVEVVNRSTTDPLYISAGGAAVVEEAGTTVVPAGQSVVVDNVKSIISAGAAPYSVERLA